VFDSAQGLQNSNFMFRWPDRLFTVLLAYGLVFLGLPVLCVLSYLWITGAL
jgi:hypothetical protein